MIKLNLFPFCKECMIFAPEVKYPEVTGFTKNEDGSFTTNYSSKDILLGCKYAAACKEIHSKKEFKETKMFEDGQFCVVKDSGELVRFVGNLNGDYRYELCVVETWGGAMQIVRMNDIRLVDEREAKRYDPEIFCYFEESANHFEELGLSE